MTIRLSWKHARQVGFLLVIGGMVCGAFYVGYFTHNPDSDVTALETEVTVFKTQICGTFENPAIAMGVPISAQNEYVIFDDGFALRLSKPHSFYIHQPGVFVLNGSEQSYALVTDTAYHPCPSQK